MVLVLLYATLLFILEGCAVDAGQNETGKHQQQMVVSDSTVNILKPEQTGASVDSELSDKKTVMFNITDRLIVVSMCNKCDMDAVIEIEKSKGNLSYQRIYNLLCTLERSCQSNAEYSQESNRMLYLLLEKCPAALMDVLNLHPDLASPYFYDQISSPLLDYNCKSIDSAVRKTKGNTQVRQSVLKALSKVRTE